MAPTASFRDKLQRVVDESEVNRGLEEALPQSDGRAAAGSNRRRRRRAVASAVRGAGVNGSRSAVDVRPMIAALAITLCGSVLAVGTVHVVVLLVVAPFAVAAGAWAILRVGRGVPGVPGPARIAFGLALYCVLQAVPLPLSLLRKISPASAVIWGRALSSLGIVARWQSLSLDPGASVVEALKWFCYGAVFCAGAWTANTRSRRAVPAIVFASAFTAALVALVHRLASADSLYGLYVPAARSMFPIAPLINPNNFAGYLNLGAFAGLGLLMGRRSAVPPWVIGLATSVVVGLSAMCGSRAGLASLAFGMVVLVLRLLRSRRYGGRRLFWVPLAALACGVALFLLAVHADLWRSMLNEGAKKLALISWTKPVIADFPIFGIGRGAFETVFPAYRADVGHHIYQFAENFLTQWCVEWGVPVGLAAFLGFAFTLRRTLLSARSDVLTLCCAVGVAVLLLQNLLDLALEVPSVSLALFALLGSLYGSRSEKQPPASLSESSAPVWFSAVFLGAFALLWTGAAVAGVRTAYDERETVAELSRQRAAGEASANSELRDELFGAIQRHPADPYFALLAATLDQGEKSAELRLISRAIERDPMAGRPYLLLADALARRHAKNQALNAVRLAVAREYELIAPGSRIVLGLTRRLDEVRLAVPDGASGVGMLVHLAQGGFLREYRGQLLSEAMNRDPLSLEPRLTRATDLIVSLESKGDACGGPGAAACFVELDALIRQVARIDPKSDRPTVFSARRSMIEGNPRAAYDLLVQNCHTFLAQADCLRTQFLAAEQLDDAPALDASATSLLAEVCSAADVCSSTALWLGHELEARGHPGSAVRMFERAAQESQSPAAWAQLAESARRLGLTAIADRARRRAGGPEIPRTLQPDQPVDSPTPGGPD